MLSIVKLLYELQHRATRLYLNLRAPLGSGKNQMHTPESVGSMMFRGRPCGDSGYALEEVLLGGRLRHWHVVNQPPFVVSKPSTLRCKISSLIVLADCSRLRTYVTHCQHHFANAALFSHSSSFL
jgi:hypothetical protein